MKIKDLLELCSDDYCSVSVHDHSTHGEEFFCHPQEAISKYGFFPVLCWKIEKRSDGCIFKIRTRTEF